MEIYDLKINGISEPLGFELPWVNVSWKVRNTGSRRGAKCCLLAAADPAFRQILYKKDSRDLNPCGETLAIPLQPRTRYYVRIEITGDAGDSACAESWFETGKMD